MDRKPIEIGGGAGPFYVSSANSRIAKMYVGANELNSIYITADQVPALMSALVAMLGGGSIADAWKVHDASGV